MEMDFDTKFELFWKLIDHSSSNQPKEVIKEALIKAGFHQEFQKQKIVIKLKTDKIHVGKTEVLPTKEKQIQQETIKKSESSLKSHMKLDKNENPIFQKERIDISELKHKELKHFLWVFVRYIYDTTSIKSVENNGKIYRQCTTSWFDGNEKREEYDSDQSCDNEESYGCDFERSDPIGEVNYNLYFNSYNENPHYYGDGDEQEFTRSYNLISETVKAKGLDTQLIFSKPLTLINKNGINNDHRGSDHVRIRLPFEPKQKLASTLTLREFAIACHRLKSHKFDYWYELYTGIGQMITNNNIVATIRFNHGS